MSNIVRSIGFDYGQNRASTLVVGCVLDHQGAAASRVVAAAPTRFLMIVARNVSVDPRFLMVFNEAAVPANGTAPDLAILPLATGEQKSYAPPLPTHFDRGLVWAMSTTDTTLTVTAGADGEVDTYTAAVG